MEYYEAASQWWVDKLKNATPDNFYNGNDACGGLLIALASTSIKRMPTEKEFASFKRHLEKIIRKRIKKDREIYLRCDYSASYYLYKAAKRAHLKRLIFPFKVQMHIKDGMVIVHDGYQQPSKQIFPKLD